MKRACRGGPTVSAGNVEEIDGKLLLTLAHECVLAAWHVQYCLQIPSLTVWIIDVASLHSIIFSK